MAKSNLALADDPTTPRKATERMAYFSHIQNSLIVYRIAEKGKSTPISKITLKLQDLPFGVKLGPVHPIEFLQQLTE